MSEGAPRPTGQTAYILAPQPIPTVAVAREERRFPVRRIFCVGRNYAAHAREMGQDPDREPPFFFTKPADAVVDDGAVIPYPAMTRNFHFEIELVAAIGVGGADIPSGRALEHVYGYAVGIDLTRRDLQFEARDKGRPWDWGKAFDLSAPCSAILPWRDRPHPTAGRIWLAVNGAIKQDADLAELIWPVADVISRLSEAMRLLPGDLVYTGTPAGVGPIVPGDRVTGGIEGIGTITLDIAAPQGGVLDIAARQGGVSDTTAPQGGVLDTAAPQGGVLDTAAPQGGVLDTAAPQGGVSDTTARQGGVGKG